MRRLRPFFVYGPGRDQGVSSTPSKAMVAAAFGYLPPIVGALAQAMLCGWICGQLYRRVRRQGARVVGHEQRAALGADDVWSTGLPRHDLLLADVLPDEVDAALDPPPPLTGRVRGHADVVGEVPALEQPRGDEVRL